MSFSRRVLLFGPVLNWAPKTDLGARDWRPARRAIAEARLNPLGEALFRHYDSTRVRDILQSHPSSEAPLTSSDALLSQPYFWPGASLAGI